MQHYHCKPCDLYWWAEEPSPRGDECPTCKDKTKPYQSDRQEETSTMDHRPLHTIAAEIASDWAKPYFGAVPYLDAMRQLNSIHGEFYNDSAKSVVAYFLANAGTWRGDTARRVKAELKGLLGLK